MTGAAVFGARKLRRFLETAANRFFLPGEFPHKEPDMQARAALASAGELTGEKLREFAAGLRSGTVDSLMLLLPEADPREAKLITRIIGGRANSRLVSLFWPLFQYHFENENMLAAAKSLLENMPQKGEPRASGLETFVLGGGFSAFAEQLCREEIPAVVFADRESLDMASPLAVRLWELFFSSCREAGFHLNGKLLLDTLAGASEESFESIVRNYLRALEKEAFNSDICMRILEKMGEPLGSGRWDGVPLELRRKFAQWVSYSRLKEHFVHNGKKLEILSRYVPYMRQICLFDKSMRIAVDFGEFVVVDENELSSFSYYLKKESYEKYAESIEKYGIDGVRLALGKVPAARDYIIEEAEETVMQLDYSELGQLYIRDMLNIMLGLSPDLRNSKSLVRRKRNKQSLPSGS